MYECQTGYLTLKEEHRLRVFENRVLRKIFGQKRMKQKEVRQHYVMKNFITRLIRQI
jgi:hypothetical protein